eukprot:gene12319-biopygen15488
MWGNYGKICWAPKKTECGGTTVEKLPRQASVRWGSAAAQRVRRRARGCAGGRVCARAARVRFPRPGPNPPHPTPFGREEMRRVAHFLVRACHPEDDLQ